MSLSAVRKQSNRPDQTQSAFCPKGFFTNDGYVGFLPDGRKLSFPTYDEYMEYITEDSAA